MRPVLRLIQFVSGAVCALSFLQSFIAVGNGMYWFELLVISFLVYIFSKGMHTAEVNKQERRQSPAPSASQTLHIGDSDGK